MKNSFVKTHEEVLDYYQTSTPRGLTEHQVQEARANYGSNQFDEVKSATLLQKMGRHLLEIMNLILLAVAALAGYLTFISGGNYTKTIVVLMIVAMNVAVSTIQEARAENALSALKKLSSPISIVTRGGYKQEIASSELVCGDCVHLTAGEAVGADIRLLSANHLQVDEASLTGESEPVDKNASVLIEPDAPLGDRLNMVFSGTNVLNGTATGIVVAIGNASQMGQIATLIEAQIKGKTPLQKRIDTLAKRLSLIAFVAGALIFVLNSLLSDVALIDNLMTAVVLGIAAVPETLPVIVSLSLIYGVQNMAEKQAIIRHIPAVETLGNATVIAADKTGTLTQNQMTIQKIWVAGEGISAPSALTEHAKQLLLYLGLASNATAQLSADGHRDIHGEPTEAAIMRLLTEQNLYQPENLPKRLHELPFDSTRKKMTVVISLASHSQKIDSALTAPVNQVDSGFLVITKGAFDRLAKDCDLEAQRVHDEFAGSALRVLALSCKLVDSLPDDFSELEKGQTLLGLIGMIDPPREESYAAVAEARTAGIKPIMITGDHALTAKAIAHDLDIYRDGDTVVTGQELSQLTEDALLETIESISVYARVSPEDKLRIVKAWQAKGQIVAMTGDGVNDAPSLKAADVGTAMGITGTEVSKSASDIILSDDNFSTLVAAVREGRRVYANIKKTIYYLLSANVAEILTMLIGAIVGWGLPFTGIQLLYINVLADGIPGFGLSRESAESNIMERPPIGVKESLFSRGVARNIAICSGAFIIVTLTGFYLGRFQTISGLSGSHQLGQTMAFVVLTLASTINVYNARSNRSIFRAGLTSNRMIFLATLLSLGITLAFTQIPVLMSVLEITSLSLTHWLIAITLALSTVLAIELSKLILSKTNRTFID
ncbi:MAG: cation-translocating P-type ATPase [Streptococcaceae bacterium]|jgi:calcium-translocating P-type ATPase|nr:cation-translocating P-type ATPase [Streptococcaceae bacterium]